MDNYLMLDGKKYELSPELAYALRSCVEPEPEKKSPFERKEDEIFFYIGHNGFVRQTFDKSYVEDNEKYAVANYCTDKSLMEQRAMHETLNRLLWRYSEEHGGDSKPWDNHHQHWCIGFKESNEPGVFRAQFNPYFGCVYFSKGETAQAAIEEIVKPFLAAHPDFVW